MTQRPPASTLPGVLREIARRHPDREAVVAPSTRLTYRALAAEVDRAARGLQRLGISRGDKVAILMGNQPEWIVAALAVTTLGAIVVSMNTWWTPREIEYALSHSDARLLVCTRRYLRHDYEKEIASLRGRLPLLRHVVGVGDELPPDWQRFDELDADQSPGEIPLIPEPDDPAFLLYTSGSTSNPKAVQLLHRGMVENTWHIGERQRLSEQDRLWLGVSLFWGFGCSNALPAVLSHGGCVVLQDSFDPGRALELMEAERCTVFYGTPNMVQAVVDHPEFATRQLRLRTGTTFGNAAQMQRALRLAPEICNVYGMTETYGNSHVAGAGETPAVRTACCGTPLPGLAQRIVHPDTEEDLPAGQIGEIRIKGYAVSYYKDEAQTDAAFDDQGYFKSRDLGCVDAEGRLQFHGRLKEMVKTGGINVSPAEIEAVLMTHPDVHLAVVVGVPHPTRDEVLAAVIVPQAGRMPSDTELLDHCRRELAPYKVPSFVRLSSEADLPLTTTGKVQKNRIAEVFFEPAVPAIAN
ncbi:AMP-dependent synthetase [Variovorax sp. WS11]|uniref:class I adenylate-forming enzyme family protein n=1 Tax=Variovorax sp. WS11 TaxID=1105204 RepID=UPI000D0D4AFC|nr:class I adenylate-forming enzyme family protein [Variovorax sp. WS11]PSL86010.1 AMP-dependent synthetase [Variovorax sp. WS11]